MFTWLLLNIEFIKICISLVSILIKLCSFISFISSSIKFKKAKFMATIKQGILGGVSGKIGSVVGSSWKGIAVLRSLALSVANPRTGPQVQQRTNFTSIVKVGSDLLGAIIVPYWNRFAVKMSGYNSFCQVNMSTFADGLLVYPNNFYISVGKMASTPFSHPDIVEGATQTTLTWDTDLVGSFQDTSDIPFAVALTNKGEVLFAHELTAQRIAGSYVIVFNRTIAADDTVFVFLGFARSNYSIVSTSTLGETT